MLCWISNPPSTKLPIPKVLQASRSFDKMSTSPPTEFPPPGYRPTPINHLLVNALDLTAPASDALLKNRKNAWVQLAGHPGSFAPASQNTIWKKRLTTDSNETIAYNSLMNDVVRECVPRFHREVEYGGETFIEIEDLLQHFTDPNILDIKMGTRTFLETEVKNPVLRKDLYEKMVKLCPEEPTAQEHEQKAITKLRYMQFRERDSSTSSLGFRLEALKMTGKKPTTDLKRVQSEDQVKQLVCQFLQGHKDVQKKLLKRFKEIRRKLESSRFFKHHEMIGSSILVLYDHQKHSSAWIIDFAKTLYVEDLTLNHRKPWIVGNHEDGYLDGLDNLIRIFSEIDVDHPVVATVKPSCPTSPRFKPRCIAPILPMLNSKSLSKPAKHTRTIENHLVGAGDNPQTCRNHVLITQDKSDRLARDGSTLSQEDREIKRQKATTEAT